MDDKLIRLARKVKTLEDELSRLSQIKDLEGLLVASNDMNSRYKKSINETVGMYKEYISNTKKELTDSFEAIKKDYDSKKDSYKKNMNNLEAKINKVKDDIQKVCTSIDKSIEDIQKDILKDIKDKNTQILNEIGKKDKELKEVKTKNASLVKDLKALKDLVNKLELQKGDDGKSAYDIACELGFKGTKEEWIKSLHGKDGQDIELRGLRAFSDVKNDNKMYARKNKKWVEVENYDDTEIREDIAELQEENETQTEQIEALQIENARLKATLPTTTDTGENITLQNTAELEFIQPPFPKGNSEQVQYSGKQLLPFTNQDVTLGGVTFKAINGRLILNGTATENINGSYFINNYFKVHLTQRNYILSRTNVNSNLTIMFLSSNVDVIGRLSRDSSDLTNSFTISAENDYYIGFYISSGVSFNNYDSGVMVSTTGGAYEPYVGGTASPNPSYPQAISNVTGDVEVLVQNKNLFEDSVKNNMWVSVEGNILTNSEGSNIKKINCSEGDSYTISATFQNAHINNILIIAFFDKNNRMLGRNAINNNTSLSLTKTAPANTAYMYAGHYIIAPTTIQLEENTIATTYTPHQEQTFTFPLGTQRMYLGDYLADDGIHHVRKQTEITANNVDSLVSSVGSGHDTYRAIIMKSSLGWKTSYDTGICLMNNYSEQTTASNIKSGNFSLNSWNQGIELYDDRFVDLTTTKQALIGTIIEIQQAEEWIEAYTTEQQEVYNQIKQAISYEEQTNISGTSDEANPLFSVEAYQSIKLVLAG